MRIKRETIPPKWLPYLLREPAVTKTHGDFEFPWTLAGARKFLKTPDSRRHWNGKFRQFLLFLFPELWGEISPESYGPFVTREIAPELAPPVPVVIPPVPEIFKPKAPESLGEVQPKRELKVDGLFVSGLLRKT